MKAGDTLHTFQILEDLGHGGMGGVYIGFDAGTKQLVAIKTLFSEFSKDEGYVRRFQREAEVYRKLDHPNIVSFVDAGFENGTYYIAMEHIKGKPLDSIVHDVGRLSVDQAVKIMGHLLDAIDHAHQQNIIHRDLKPQNIMISEEGVVKLLDFGIAAMDDNLVKTVTGSILGTFFYSSPEQNQGKKVDERSDLYSLGLVFWEMLCGERALHGATLLEVTAIQMRQGIPLPSTKVSDMPAGIDRILEKMLAKNPNDRYDVASEVIKDLQQFKENPEAGFGGDAGDEIGEKCSRAKDLFLKGETDIAEMLTKQVLEHKRDSADVWAQMGKIQAKKGQTFACMESFDKALKLNPEDDELKLDYGVWAFKLGQFDKARLLLKDYLDCVDPDNVYAKNYLRQIEDKDAQDKAKRETAEIAKLRALAKANRD
jgi:serine/threonine protein kinase